MATTAAMFCAHKRLRTACRACTPTLSVPSAIGEEDADFPVPKRR